MSTENSEGGPGAEAASKSLSNVTDSTACTDIPERTRAVVAKFQDAYAVVVIGKASRRHVFFGLPAASKAVERAHARGDFADLVLVRLVPVGEV